jgi:hypothetical protein
MDGDGRACERRAVYPYRRRRRLQLRGDGLIAAALLLLVAGAVVLVLSSGPPAVNPLAGLGQKESEKSERSETKTQRTIRRPLAVRPTAAATPPEAVVAEYYAALNARRFGPAWRTLSPAVRAAFGGFAAWRAGYGATLSSRPVTIRVGTTGARATVEHDLIAADRTGCGPVRRRFAVTWALVRRGGRWRAEGLSAVKRSGPEPSAACS